MRCSPAQVIGVPRLDGFNSHDNKSDNYWRQALEITYFRRNFGIYAFSVENCGKSDMSDGMSSCPEPTNESATIANALTALGPRTVEGDQGRVSMHSVHDAIAAMEYDRKRTSMKNRAAVRSMLLTISNHRLATHDGRAS